MFFPHGLRSGKLNLHKHVLGLIHHTLQSGVSTALPIIVRDLNGTQFEWVGSAYALSATALMPLSGGLAQVRGTDHSTIPCFLLLVLGLRAEAYYATSNILLRSWQCFVRRSKECKLPYCGKK